MNNPLLPYFLRSFRIRQHPFHEVLNLKFVYCGPTDAYDIEHREWKGWRDANFVLRNS